MIIIHQLVLKSYGCVEYEFIVEIEYIMKNVDPEEQKQLLEV